MKVFLGIVNAVLAVAYPVALWWALTHRSPRTVGLVAMSIVVPLVGMRVFKSDRTHLWPVLRLPLSVMALLLTGTLLNEPVFFLFLPVLISAALLAQFAFSLKGEMPIIERFARMQEPELGEGPNGAAKVAHCRQVTVAWCVFFSFNGALAGVLALVAPTRWWAIYAGGIAYALMGGMFVGEYILRKVRFRDYGRGPHDRLLAMVWPPRPNEEDA